MENTEESPFLPYNSERPDLVIPEYGRNIQQMVEFAVTIEDREERNTVAKAIISVMGQLFPYLRDIEDYKHKLWDHLYVMSGFKLDVDSPYPKPSPETFASPPERVPYPAQPPRFGHYGKVLERMIEKAAAMEEGDEKTAFTKAIGDLMKRQYVLYNRHTVEDKLIRSQIREMSGGKLSLPAEYELISAAEVIKTHGPHQSAGNPKKGGSKKKKKKKH